MVEAELSQKRDTQIESKLDRWFRTKTGKDPVLVSGTTSKTTIGILETPY